MATDQGSFNIDRTFKAAADLSAKQFHFVRITADNTVGACTLATHVPVGVLQNNPNAANRAAVVRMFGVSKVSSDDALTAGYLIGTSADGQADFKDVGVDTTEYAVGTILVGTTAANGIAEALINCLNPTRAN